MNAPVSKEENKKRLKEVARLFARLGFTAFGGPAVHIALMEEEVVRKKNWITHQHFLDLMGATNLIPGPNSTEMAMHIGQERAGWRGLLVAGCCFILPAVLITGIIAWAYAVYGQLPQVQPFLYGIKPAVIAVIAATMVFLGKKAVKNGTLAVIGLLSMVAALAGLNEIAVLFAAGAVGILLYLATKNQDRLSGFAPFVLLQVAVPAISASKLFFIFLKIGSILYGSGYVLFAFLDAELVAPGFLTKQQLTDAIAVGQFTPGPVFSSATFIGWQLGGIEGALAATAGIFLPSFFFVALLNPLIARLRQSRVMAAFLDAVNVASIGLIFAICFELGSAALADWKTTVIALLSFFTVFFFRRLNTAFVILGGSLLGYLLWLI